MKPESHTKKTLLFLIFIFLAAIIGQRVAHGYIHPADVVIVLAAMMLPLPHALLAAGLASVAVDLLKGLYLMAPATLVIKLLMVLAVKALLKSKLAGKHPEIAAVPALFLPVPGYYLAELLNQLITGAGAAAFKNAAITLQADLIQAAAGVLILIFVYDMIKGIVAGRAELRRQKEAEQKEESTDEDA